MKPDQRYGAVGKHMSRPLDRVRLAPRGRHAGIVAQGCFDTPDARGGRSDAYVHGRPGEYVRIVRVGRRGTEHVSTHLGEGHRNSHRRRGRGNARAHCHRVAYLDLQLCRRTLRVRHGCARRWSSAAPDVENRASRHHDVLRRSLTDEDIAEARSSVRGTAHPRSVVVDVEITGRARSKTERAHTGPG